ncbi:MAG: exodeoxyribonuclease VII large subunit [Alphaproteobacteria bacterium]
MSEKPEAEDSFHNLPVYSVSEISGAVKKALESGFSHIRVRGEISGFKRATSGHVYFALKDEEAVLDAVSWRGTLPRLGFALEDGLEVIATGRISSYPGRSKYQIIVEEVELAGEGALLKLLADRRKKLEAEGLFAPERKKELPFLPEVIGVVTSPTGAVIRDILHRLADRFPRRVLLWPVAVQGEGAAEQIAAAIQGFNDLPETGSVPRPDLLIVARGGGSLEDLWAFNEEIVVRAAAASKIPLISAIGHETDVTLIDFAADLRAPTPTAAAEMAVPVRAELLAGVLDHARRMVGGMARLLTERRNRLEALRRGLPDPVQILSTAMQRLDDRAERLSLAMTNLRVRLADRVAKTAAKLRQPGILINEKRSQLVSESRAFATAAKALAAHARLRLDHAAALLESFSFKRVLDRGFALVTDAGELPVTAAAVLGSGQDIAIHFHDGAIGARVTGARSAAKATPAADPKKSDRKISPKKKDGRQGELL